MSDFQKKLYIICGPTASGKSYFAMKIAHMISGEIICADSMQIYKDLKILSASPSDWDKEKVLHHLYNFKNPDESFSSAAFAENASLISDRIIEKSKIPIIVGGTGFYIDSLVNGISKIPEISKEYREEIIKLSEEKGLNYLYEKLKLIDPESHDRLNPNDKNRILRAYEVTCFTGKPLSYFRKQSKISPLNNYDIKIIYLCPTREILYKNCNDRFISMIKDGAIDEVEKLKNKQINKISGIKNTIGYKEFCDFIDGKSSLEESITLAQTKTRQYAKRQITWFNNQLDFSEKIIYDDLTKLDEIIEKFKSYFKL